MAEVGRRAQIAYRGGSTVSVSFEQGGKAIQVRPARTSAQAPKRLRCRKIGLQHRVPLSSAFGGRITVFARTSISGAPILWGAKGGKIGRNHLKVSRIGRSTARRLTITKFAHKTGVVGDAAVAAILATLDMPAECGRAALLDRRHHLELTQAHMPGIGSAPVGSMAMKDVCDLQPRGGHGRSARPRVAVPLWSV